MRLIVAGLGLLFLLTVVTAQKRYVTFSEVLVLLSFVDKEWGMFCFVFILMFISTADDENENYGCKWFA